MDNTYIKLYRKSLENGWLKNHKLWVFWSYCLLKASHKKHKQLVGNQQVELSAGQFVYGRKAASFETGLSDQSLRTCIKSLEKLGNLTIKSTNKYSLITVVNWEEYQCSNQQTNQQTNTYLTSTQPAPNHKQECKNGRMEEKEKKVIKEKKPGIKPKRLLPKDFTLTPERMKIAIDERVKNPARAFASMCDWAKANNKMYADWEAVWRNWCRNELTEKIPENPYDFLEGGDEYE